MAYRSAISYTLSGSVVFSAVPAASPANGSVTLDVKMPDTLSLSGVHKLNDNYEVMADVTWTGWSSFKELKVVRSSGAPLSITTENWKDTVRASIGATHRYNDQWLVRAGFAFDQAPVQDAFRTARIPDNNRTWLALGGQYKTSASGAIDFGYAHLFVKDSTIDSAAPPPAPGATPHLIGTYKNKVDILSAQYTHTF